MKKMLIFLLCLVVALSSFSLFACESEGEEDGKQDGDSGLEDPGDPVDPGDHTHVYSVTWDWDVDGIEKPNTLPTAQLSCTVPGCAASAKELRDYFSGLRAGYYLYTYMLYDTAHLPTEDSEGVGVKHVYAVKKGDTTRTRLFEDSHNLTAAKLTPIVPVEGPIYDYLTATTSKEQYKVLSEHNAKTQSTDYSQQITTHTISIGVSTSGAKLSVYDITKGYAGRSLAFETTDFAAKFTSQSYLPQHTYYWEVTKGSDVLQNGTFLFSKDISVRYVSVGGVSNFRDLGGWAMDDGNTMPYGLVYRAAKLNDINAAGRATVLELGIKTEIDLRDAGSDPPVDPVLEGVNYYKYYTTNRDKGFFTGINNGLQTGGGTPVGKYITPITNHKQAYQDIFHILSEKENYPIVFHCTSGADRTGTLAFLIEALLGVSEEDLVKDYELTSFAGSGKNRWRSDPNAAKDDFGTGAYNLTGWYTEYTGMVELVKTYNGNTLSEKIAYFLEHTVGVPKAQIDSIKAIFGYTK